MIPDSDKHSLKVKAKFDMTGLPHWMLPEPVRGEINERSWQTILDDLSTGDPLTTILEDRLGMTSKAQYSRVLRWIFADETRKAEYIQAREIGTEIIADDSLKIADGVDNPIEDVQRSTLRVNQRRWLMSKWNKDRYGDHKQVENTVVIDIGDAMLEAQRRVEQRRSAPSRAIEGEVIRGED